VEPDRGAAVARPCPCLSAKRVLGLTDWGLDLPEWFESIRQLGAHPVMQTGGDGRVLVAGGAEWQALQDLVPCPNTRGEGRCRVFRINTLECTVLAVWACGRRGWC
jgi:hypothetical protein